MIIQLKKTNPEEYEKAGKPWWFWGDHRSFIFMSYILTGKYKNIKDQNMANLFHAARVLTIILIASMIFFFISISVSG